MSNGTIISLHPACSSVFLPNGLKVCGRKQSWKEKSLHCILNLSWLEQEATFPLSQMECGVRNLLLIGQRGSADCRGKGL